ncbi:MAG TPA: biopolymer transporter ExbD [Candidatus Sulfotelmatobacter sp.]
MKSSLFTCLIVVILGPAGAMHAAAQTPAWQKGVSVQMVVTNNATPMPEADKQDAWIVAVTAPGQMYFGTEAVSAEQLSEEMKTHPRNRNAKLYIKADARAPYATVQKTLHAAKEVMFDNAVLLTKQPEAPALGMMVPPKGFDVSLTPASEAVVVQVSNSGQKVPELKVNSSAVSAANLQAALNQALQNRKQRLVIVKADPQLPFADVVHIIDAARSVGAEAVLPAAEM